MLSKHYFFQQIEPKWKKIWNKKNHFLSSISYKNLKQSLTLLMPPPNITGGLTMGHVLNSTIQDIIIRYFRQKKYNVIWIPGTDHAGIATQIKIEKSLLSTNPIYNISFNKNILINYAQSWKKYYNSLIIKQLKMIGLSCDWSCFTHTLDKRYTEQVLKIFINLFNKNKIYKGKKIINWCSIKNTALSDEEVIKKQERKHLYIIKYFLAYTPCTYILISTSRPETIFVDSAIAIHPKDNRYNKLIGKKALIPLLNKIIPIISSQKVKITFSTGILKITPAHDLIDFNIGKIFNLPFNNLKKIPTNEKLDMISRLKNKSFLKKEISYQGIIQYSERSNGIVYPILSEQWFLRYPEINNSQLILKNQYISFIPYFWKKVYFNWLNNIKDWCISRQLWWGQNFPIWYKKQLYRKNKIIYASIKNSKNLQTWKKDNNILDTWVSSWGWSFIPLGWNQSSILKRKFFQYYYPSYILVTAPDIIFFWVSRMIMASLAFIKSYKKSIVSNHPTNIPFKNVFFTGIIRDSNGQKMSKSLGNSPDPIQIIQEYGADSLRFTLISLSSKGKDILFNKELINKGKNFCNKLWNVCRFILHFNQNIPIKTWINWNQIVNGISQYFLNEQDIFILLYFQKLLRNYNIYIQNFSFDIAINLIYKFFWNYFCNWYIETSKFRAKNNFFIKRHLLSIQHLIIKNILLLIHPYMPFITEELWYNMNYGITSIQIEYPLTELCFLKLLNIFNIQLKQSKIQLVKFIQQATSQLRYFTNKYNIKNHNQHYLYYCPNKNYLLNNSVLKLITFLIKHSFILTNNDQISAQNIITPLGTFYLKNYSVINNISTNDKKILKKNILKKQKQIYKAFYKILNKNFSIKVLYKIQLFTENLLKKSIKQEKQIKYLINNLSNNIKT